MLQLTFRAYYFWLKNYSNEQVSQVKLEILVRAILADKYVVRTQNFVLFWTKKINVKIVSSWELLYELDYPESQLFETKFVKTLCLLKQASKYFSFEFEIK